MTKIIPFPHNQSAHCESGVTSNLLQFAGHKCSEALAFGIGEGIFFGYLPFIKINKLPLTTYRCAVGKIFNTVNKRLGIHINRQKFRTPYKAMAALDQMLAKGIPVGCQTGAYWLPYFPPAFRFHFNMHNLVVIGKENDEYIISDPVFDSVVRCKSADLSKARFAKGALAPKGTMYYLESSSSSPDLEKAARDGMKSVCKTMLKTPVPFLGVRGIEFLANRLVGWPAKLGEELAILYLGQLIRMQEEIGTGGGGFRFMYAAFLQEAAILLNEPRLNDISEQMTLVGDTWRQFAVKAARICKGRAKTDDSYENLSELLKKCSRDEKQVYLDITELLH